MERLEKIKKSIDPNNMFQVYHGIGERDVSPQQEYKWPNQVPTDYEPLQNVASVSISYNNNASGGSSSDDDSRRLRGRKN